MNTLDQKLDEAWAEWKMYLPMKERTDFPNLDFKKGFEYGYGMYWCEDKILDTDVPYIREDLVDQWIPIAEYKPEMGMIDLSSPLGRLCDVHWSPNKKALCIMVTTYSIEIEVPEINKFTHFMKITKGPNE